MNISKDLSSGAVGWTAAGICVYYTDICDLMDLPGIGLLPPGRRTRLFRFRKTEDRARCLAAGLLLRQYIGAGEPLRGKYGKPYFEHGPQFGLAHSGSYVVLAVAELPVGVDIEQHAPWDERVAQRVFQPPELHRLHAADDPAAAFYALWTAKESIMKADGAGFHMPPETIAIDMDAAKGRDASGRAWRLCWCTLPGHTLCTAHAGMPREVVLVPTPREELLHEQHA